MSKVGTRRKKSGAKTNRKPTGAKRRTYSSMAERTAEAWAAERSRRARRAAATPPAPAGKVIARTGAVILAVFAGAMWLGGFLGDTAGATGRALAIAAGQAGFVVRHVDVRGAERTDVAEINRRLLVEPGELIFNLDPDAARRRIEELDWVGEAAVIRLLPNRVVVIVKERAPVALHVTEAGATVIDASGAPIESASPAEWRGLPVVSGAGSQEAAAELVAALARRPDLARQAAYFERIGARRWDVTLQNGARVKLPEGAVEPGLERLAALLEATVSEAPLALVDLRGGGLVLRGEVRPGWERGA